jgi:hypothetical protein
MPSNRKINNVPTLVFGHIFGVAAASGWLWYGISTGLFASAINANGFFSGGWLVYFGLWLMYIYLPVVIMYIFILFSHALAVSAQLKNDGKPAGISLRTVFWVMLISAFWGLLFIPLFFSSGSSLRYSSATYNDGMLGEGIVSTADFSAAWTWAIQLDIAAILRSIGLLAISWSINGISPPSKAFSNVNSNARRLYAPLNKTDLNQSKVFFALDIGFAVAIIYLGVLWLNNELSPLIGLLFLLALILFRGLALSRPSARTTL